MNDKTSSRLANPFRNAAVKVLHKMEDRLTRKAKQKWESEGVDLTNVTFVYHNH